MLSMHRMLAVLALVALPLSAQSFDAGTPRHALSINRKAVNGDLAYDVRVTERDSNRVLLSSTLNGKHSQSTTEVKGDPNVWVQIGENQGVLAAVMRIEAKGVTSDLITTSWLVEPMTSAAMEAPSEQVRPYRVGGDVKAPVLKNRVEPVYPEKARKDGVEGIVILEATIDATGHVRDVHVLKELPDGLSESAMNAVRKWTFAPATLAGKPVDVIFNLTVSFHLAPKYPFPGEG